MQNYYRPKQIKGAELGLGPQLLADLAELKAAGKLPPGNRVVEIGAQQLSNSFLRATDLLDSVYRLFERARIDLGYKGYAVDPIVGAEVLPDEAPSSRLFWESLGYNYAAIEYAGHRDAISLDLNRDQVPASLRASFDLVVNTGTTEHVANQDNAFRIIHDLTAPGGLMIHDVPAGGMLTHGLFGYNMQFFFVLCRENEYEVLDLGLVHVGSAPLHSDVVGSNAQFARLGSHSNPLYSIQMEADFNVPIFMIRAVLRKPNPTEYVTPLDVPEELLAKVRASRPVPNR